MTFVIVNLIHAQNNHQSIMFNFLVFIDYINISAAILTSVSIYGIDVCVHSGRVCVQTCAYEHSF